MMALTGIATLLAASGAAAFHAAPAAARVAVVRRATAPTCMFDMFKPKDEEPEEPEKEKPKISLDGLMQVSAAAAEVSSSSCSVLPSLR